MFLLGQRLKIFTNHKTVACKNFNNDRVFWRRLILEEYGLEIKYILGHKNIASDSLSRIPNVGIQTNTHKSTYNTENVSEPYYITKMPEGTLPILFKVIDHYQ